MNEVRNIQIGFELKRDTCALSCYDRQAKEPVCIPTKTGTSLFSFPTVLCKMKTDGSWQFGLEAQHFASQGDGIPVEDLYERALGEEKVQVGREEMEPWELLAVLIRESLKLLGVQKVVRAISGITVTTPSLTPVLIRNLKRALETVGFRKGQYFLQDSLESFFYFCMSQPSAIWRCSTALMVFRGREVSFCPMRENKRTTPAVSVIEQKASVSLAEDPDVRDLMLLEYVSQHMGDELYTGIFMTGDGFDREWAKRTVSFLARGSRHLFYEEMLFCKGACYTSYVRTETHSLDGHLYIGPDVVRTSVILPVLASGREASVTLAKAGKNWFENDETCEIILDGTDRVTVTLTSLDGMREEEASLLLPGLPARPNRTTRLRLHAVCTSAVSCALTAEDLGFGEFFPATHKKWQTTLDLEDSL